MTRVSTAARLAASTRRTGSASVASSDLRITEREFQRQVTDLAGYLGWEWAHFRPAQTSKGWRTPVSGPLGAGWVDLTLIRRRDRRLVFAELKTEKGRLSSRQEAVLDLLRVLGTCPATPHLHDQCVAVHVWRPSHLASGEIEGVLR